MAEEFVSVIQRYMQIDPNGCTRPSRSYTVRSIYFDNASLDRVFEKLSGQASRTKFRLRTYNEPGSAPVFLERKAKNGLYYVKHRIAVAERLLPTMEVPVRDIVRAADLPDGHRRVAAAFLREVHQRGVGPTVLVVYEREAYVCPWDDTLRVTFDRNLRGRPFPKLGEICEEDGMTKLVSDWVVVEIKVGKLIPSWLSRLVSRFQLTEQAFSKYCACAGRFLGRSAGCRRGTPKLLVGVMS